MRSAQQNVLHTENMRPVRAGNITVGDARAARLAEAGPGRHDYGIRREPQDVVCRGDFVFMNRHPEASDFALPPINGVTIELPPR